MKYCPNGHEVSDTVKYCPQCGAEIQNEVIDEIHFCKKCGYERKGTENFCSHCGNPFNCIAESSWTTQTYKNDMKKSSSYIVLISLLIIVPSLLMGGFLIYKHVEENKRLEKIRIEANEKAAEAERKRIEEENKLDNKFYKLATNSSYVWATTQGSINGKNYNGSGEKIYLYFYPKDKEYGNVSILTWDNYYSMFVRRGSGKTQYRVRNGNSIYFKFVNMSSVYSGNYDYEYNLDIINDGEYVKLVRLDGQEYRLENKTKNDPLR